MICDVIIFLELHCKFVNMNIGRIIPLNNTNFIKSTSTNKNNFFCTCVESRFPYGIGIQESELEKWAIV